MRSKRHGSCFKFLGFVFCMLLGACATSQSSRHRGHQFANGVSVPPNSGLISKYATPREAREYRTIHALYQRAVTQLQRQGPQPAPQPGQPRQPTFFDPAIQRMVSFERAHRHSAQLPMVENLHGLSLLLSGRPRYAIPHFKKAIAANPSNVLFNQYIRYNLAKAQYDAKQLDEAQQTLADLSADSLDKDTRLKVYYLRSQLYWRLGLPQEAAREALIGSRVCDPAEARTTLGKIVEQALQEVKSIDTLSALYHDFDDSPIADVVLIRLGAQEMAYGNTGTGEDHLKTLLSKFSASPYLDQAKELLLTSQSQSIVDPHAIGVLLPMKGKFAKFGQRNLQAIETAFKIFDTDQPDPKISLVVEDSGEEPEQAIAALNRLVFQYHVAGVIGPLLSKGADQVTQRGQELGVPMLSLARHAGTQGDYVFHAGLTLQIQAFEAARYTIDKLGLKRIAIIYPNDKVGTEMMEDFWNSAEQLGGKIVGCETYAPGETDFRQAVDRLSGLYYSEARQRELDDLAKLRETNNITKRNRRTEQYFALKPIVDYDAVFIPDEPRVAGQILPTFAYRDVDNVKFIGTSAWNSPEFITRTQNYGEKAFFFDAFNPDSELPKIRSFIDQFKIEFGQDPNAMDAIAFDAGAIMESAMTGVSEASPRSDLRDRLKGVHGFPGITGKISYRDGIFYRDLKAFTVRGGKIVEAL